MPLQIYQLREIAQQVAREVRRKVPRSSNRFLDINATVSEWSERGAVPYMEVIHSLVRTGTKGVGQTGVRQEFGQEDMSIKALKNAVLDFIKNGQIDGKSVNLSYKQTTENTFKLGEERAYSKKFAAALAQHLNLKGLRYRGAPFDNSVLNKIQNVIEGHQRLGQSLAMEQKTAMLKVHGHKQEFDPTLRFPPKYIGASGRSAIKFGVGNCEELACTAFAMLLAFKRSDDQNLHNNLASQDLYKVELVQARDWKLNAHFFVLINRPGLVDVFDDFDNWFNNYTVVVCDPWVTDTGDGGAGSVTGVVKFRETLVCDGKTPSSLTVRAVGYLGKAPVGFGTIDEFKIAV
jgi:hypothetical protein